jgi:chorismate mutase
MSNEIKELRKELDSLDDQISELLQKRIETGKKIVKLKKEAGISKDDPDREQEILERISSGKSEIAELLKSLYGRIFDWVKNH